LDDPDEPSSELGELDEPSSEFEKPPPVGEVGATVGVDPVEGAALEAPGCSLATTTPIKAVPPTAAKTTARVILPSRSCA